MYKYQTVITYCSIAFVHIAQKIGIVFYETRAKIRVNEHEAGSIPSLKIKSCTI